MSASSAQRTGMEKPREPDLSFTQNRELSWLRFNERILEKARDRSEPLLERLRFLSIFSNNLDEFLMVRGGTLSNREARGDRTRDQKSGLTPRERLEGIWAALPALAEERELAFSQLERELLEQGIIRTRPNGLTPKEREMLALRFQCECLPLFAPVAVGRRHPLPPLKSASLCVGALLEDDGKRSLGLAPVPKGLPPFLVLARKPFRFFLTEDLLSEFGGLLFEGCRVLELCVFSVLRNADLCLDSGGADYAAELRDLLEQRETLAPVCLKARAEQGGALLSMLEAAFGLNGRTMLAASAPLDLSWQALFAQSVGSQTAGAFLYPPHRPVVPRWAQGGAALEQVLRRDRLLSYPYESFEVFLGLLFEAAEDESVLSIRMTVYRLAEDSRVAAALLKAAGRGCEVTVLVELQARFDEERNAGWAERLRRAGCTVLYGVEGLKVHAKLLLITRRQGERLSAITQIGTGNYHERTAKQYADLSFVTADPVIGADAARFFRSLALSRPGGEYRKLVAAPKDLRARLFALIDGEIRKAEAGGAGHIILKVNSLSERGIIDRLSAASCAGVKVELIVRGVCCLLPGVAGKTENITVTSVVGRFLEHSRIYCFGDGEERRIWISSADLMGRNLFGRAELACPIEDPSLKDRLSGLLDLMLRDNVGARRLSPDGRYRPIPNAGGPPLIDCQAALAEDAAKRESKQPKPSHRTPRPGRSAPPLPPRQ